MVRGNRYAEALLGQVWIGRPWNLATYGKGISTGSSRQWTVRFWKGSCVQVPVVSLSFGSLCVCVCVGVRLWFLVQLEVALLPRLPLHDLRCWSVVSDQRLSIFLNRTGPVWAGSVVIIIIIPLIFKTFGFTNVLNNKNKNWLFKKWMQTIYF